MTRNTVPAGVAALFDGTNLAEKVGETALLIAPSQPFPRVAALSVGEVLVDGDQVALLLYPVSRTTEALRSSGRGLLHLVDDGAIVRIGVEVTENEGAFPGRAVFSGRIAEVDIDAVGYARLLHGIGFELVDQRSVVERWENQVDTLREVLA